MTDRAQSPAVLRIGGLPGDAVEAAASFYAKWAPQAKSALEEGAVMLALVMEAAPSDHDDWRRAAVRDLARDHAPQRIVLVAGGDEAAVSEALGYLGDAPGVTGQYLKLG